MENNNDKSKTEKFTPMNKSPKPEINRSGNDAYSEARRTPEYDFNDDGDDGGNNKLVVVSVLLAVLLVIVIVLSIFVIGATKNDNTEDENPPVEIEEIVEEENEKTEEVKEGNYNIVFYAESIIEKNGYAIIDADLFDDEMNKIKSRKIKIGPETRIISGEKIMTKNSLLYLIENVVDEKIVFEGTIQEEDGLALKLYFEYEAEIIPEAETPEEPVLEDPPAENPEDITENVTEEIPEQVPVETPGVTVE